MSTTPGSVYQRSSDGKWIAALVLNGKRKVQYAKTEREARKKLGELQGQIATTGTLPSPGRRTIDDLLSQWLESAGPTLKPRTKSEYEALARRHVSPVIGKVRLAHLEPSHIQALCNRLTIEGKKRQSKLVFNLLHKALGMAVLWGWLATNPSDRVLKPAYRPARKEVWSGEELASFLDGSRDCWLHPLFVVCASSGCRIGELMGLKWEDVNLSRGTLTIRRNLQRIDGEWVESSPKSKSGERLIILPKEALEAIRRQRAMQAERRLRAGPVWEDRGLVFTGVKGNPLQKSVVFHALQRECKRLGLPEISPHQFRHIHASLLLSKGLPITAVSQRLGHASPTITMSIYAHAMKQQDQEAADIIGQVLAR